MTEEAITSFEYSMSGSIRQTHLILDQVSSAHWSDPPEINSPLPGRCLWFEKVRQKLPRAYISSVKFTQNPNPKAFSVALHQSLPIFLWPSWLIHVRVSSNVSWPSDQCTMVGAGAPGQTKLFHENHEWLMMANSGGEAPVMDNP